MTTSTGARSFGDSPPITADTASTPPAEAPMTTTREGGKGGYLAGWLQSITPPGDVRGSVLKAGADWEVLSTFDLGERVIATPAIADGRVFVRTETALYAFGIKPSN